MTYFPSYCIYYSGYNGYSGYSGYREATNKWKGFDTYLRSFRRAEPEFVQPLPIPLTRKAVPIRWGPRPRDQRTRKLCKR